MLQLKIYETYDRIGKENWKQEDLEEIRPYLARYCELFGCGLAKLLDAEFTVVTPDSKNPYKQMYVQN